MFELPKVEIEWDGQPDGYKVTISGISDGGIINIYEALAHYADTLVVQNLLRHRKCRSTVCELTENYENATDPAYNCSEDKGYAMSVGSELHLLGMTTQEAFIAANLKQRPPKRGVADGHDYEVSGAHMMQNSVDGKVAFCTNKDCNYQFDLVKETSDEEVEDVPSSYHDLT